MVLLGSLCLATSAQAKYGQPVLYLSNAGSEFMAMDAQGDLYYDGSGGVIEATPDGTRIPVGTGIEGAEGIAVDSQGDVFIADAGNSRIVEVTPGGEQITAVSGIEDPTGLAVDPFGDIFAISEGSIVEIAPDGTRTTVGTGITPVDIAVDSQGDLFTDDDSTFDVDEITPSGVQTTLDNNVVGGRGMAVDSAGNVYVAQEHDGDVVGIEPDGTEFGAGIVNRAIGVAVDSAGDVFVADNSTDQVWEVPIDNSPDETSTTVNCGPVSDALVPHTCRAVVDNTSTGIPPTGTVIFSAASEEGVFPDGDSCSLANGSCSVSYTPEIAGSGSESITAYYSGDVADPPLNTGFYPSTGTGTLEIYALADSETLTCAHVTRAEQKDVVRGRIISIACRVSVIGSGTGAPPATGTVSFSASPSADAGERFSAPECFLSGRVKPHCQVSFRTASADHYTITAAYSSAFFFSNSALAGVSTVSSAEAQLPRAGRR